MKTSTCTFIQLEDFTKVLFFFKYDGKSWNFSRKRRDFAIFLRNAVGRRRQGNAVDCTKL